MNYKHKIAGIISDVITTLRKMTIEEFEDFASQAGFIDQYIDLGKKRENIIAMVLSAKERDRILNRWLEILKANKSQEGELPIDAFAKIKGQNMKIKLSSRDNDFNAETKLQFPNEFAATTLAKNLYYLGYKDEKGLTEQFKERNFEINDAVKGAIKGVLELAKNPDYFGYEK